MANGTAAPLARRASTTCPDESPSNPTFMKRKLDPQAKARATNCTQVGTRFMGTVPPAGQRARQAPRCGGRQRRCTATIGASTRTIGLTTALTGGLTAAAMPMDTPSTTAMAKPANNRNSVAAISC